MSERERALALQRQMEMREPSRGNPAERFLGQAARSMAGAVDSVVTGAENDVRRFMGADVIPYGEGRVQTLLENAQIASPDAPEGVLERSGAAMGDAVTALLPLMKTLDVARKGSGPMAAIAEDLYKSLATKWGIVTEAASGAGAGAGEAALDEAGAPEWAQQLGAIVGGMGVPASVNAAVGGTKMGLNAVDKISDMTLLTRGVKNVGKMAADKAYITARDAGKAAYRTFVPMTEQGAMEQAGMRARELVGEERAPAVGEMIDPADPLGRTAAEQTGDPNLIGAQRAAAEESPVAREALAESRANTEARIVEAVRAEGGDIEDARTFFRRRLSQYGKAIDERINQALQAGDEVIQGVRSGRDADEMSEAVVERLRQSLAGFKVEERKLWSEVDRTSMVPTERLKELARQMEAETSIFQRDDIPEAARLLLSNEIGDEMPASEAHGLYSKMREIARNARFGQDRSDNVARLADQLADAADEALETVPGRTAADARALTRQIHQKFDQGAPGRILARNRQGGTQIPEEEALARTVGRRGSSGSSTRSITEAAPDAQQEVSDFLRESFFQRVSPVPGEFNPRAARLWMRDNESALKEFPDLRAEFETALQSRERTQALAIRLEERKKALADSTIARFNSGAPEKAVTAIIGADYPARAAKSVVRQASKDETGAALDGVKAAFTDYLTADVNKLPALMADPKTAAAMKEIFTPQQMTNLKRLSTAMARFDEAGANVGDVMNTPANKVIDMLARILAAKTATQMHPGGNAGVDLQTAQMASARTKEFLARLTNDRAREILMKAIVEDPGLMRTLLMDTPGGEIPKQAIDRLTPFLVGTTAAGVAPEE